MSTQELKKLLKEITRTFGQQNMKPVPTFADRGVSHGQHGGSTTVVNLGFSRPSRYFSYE
jgi:hypothetical protein